VSVWAEAWPCWNCGEPRWRHRDLGTPGVSGFHANYYCPEHDGTGYRPASVTTVLSSSYPGVVTTGFAPWRVGATPPPEERR